jgi:glucose-1-phosphate adenylyltransferase
VLAGGRGSRLRDLTNVRAKPAVHFGGKFRIIDFALSNCLNSGLRRIGVITQYKSHSLLRHLQRGWSFLRNEMNEFVDLLPAQQRVDEEHWYQGTADAVWQNLDIIRNSTPPDYIVMLAGDHIYKMDYSVMLEDHVASGRGCHRGLHRGAAGRGEGLWRDGDRRRPPASPSSKSPPTRRHAGQARCMSLASMGIYVFSADYLYRLLEDDGESGLQP